MDSQRAIQEKIALLNMRGDNTKAAEIMSEASTQPQPAPCWSLSTPGMDAYEMFAVDINSEPWTATKITLQLHDHCQG